MSELQRQDIVRRIRQARKEAGLSQPEMADAINVAPRTYQNYESSRVPWGLINDIARVSGKSPEWLLHGEPAPVPDINAILGGTGGRLQVVEAKLDLILKTLGVSEESAAVDAFSAEVAGPELPAQEDERTKPEEGHEEEEPPAPAAENP